MLQNKALKEESPRRRGMVLPSVFVVLMVLVVLAFSLTYLGMQNLGNAVSYSQDDKALYAADTGLVHALAEYQSTGELPDRFSGEVKATGATYRVDLIENHSEEPLPVPGGASIPPGTAYLLSEGRSGQRSLRRSALLLQTGLGSMQVGALAERLTVQDSLLGAYDSSRDMSTGDEPDAEARLPDEVVIATNSNSGTPIRLIDTEVLGTIFVGPGGDPNELISREGDTQLRRQSTLLERIDVPPIELPDIPGTFDDEVMTAQPLYRPHTYSSDGFSVSRDSNGVVTGTNQCFSFTLKPDGTFYANENSGQRILSGNVQTGTFVNSGPQNFTHDWSPGGHFEIGGYFHGLVITSDGTLKVDKPSNDPGALWDDGGTSLHTAPEWLAQSFFGSPGEDLVNPDQLDSGRFGEVKIDSVATKLGKDAVLIVKDLIIGEGGRIQLPEDSTSATIYVTGSLSVDGENAVLNDTRKPPNLKIFYTGDKPVRLTGGSDSFLTLLAPNADVFLNGHDSSFYGALVGREVLIQNAKFFFDVATEGVGTGTDGTTMKVLSRHRL